MLGEDFCGAVESLGTIKGVLALPLETLYRGCGARSVLTKTRLKGIAA